MRKKQFEHYIDENTVIKYISLYHLEQMTKEQKIAFRKAHNPWVILSNEDGEETYEKLNEYIDEEGNLIARHQFYY